MVHEEIGSWLRASRRTARRQRRHRLTGPEQARAQETLRTNGLRHGLDPTRSIDWWSDHLDSPLFFILAIGDYVRTTGDDEPAERHWPLVKSIFGRYSRLHRERPAE